MHDEEVTTEELLQAWRDATRAADLAERLARLASETGRRAGLNAAAAEEVATMAERAAKSANAAAQRARRTATEAREIAARDEAVTTDAEATEVRTREAEATARDAYHGAEAEARARHIKTEV